MSDEEYPQTTKNGWVFPAGVPTPPDHAWHRFPVGDKTVWGFDWNHHVEIAREAGLEGIDAEVQTAGAVDGLLYAGVRVEVTVDGETYACVHGADAASNQVRDDDMVFAVAESRATKRAVKKALGVVPADEDTSGASDSTTDTSDVPDNAPDDVDDYPSNW